MTYHTMQHNIPQTLQEANTIDKMRDERRKAYSEYLLAKEKFQEDQYWLKKAEQARKEGYVGDKESIK